MATQYVSPVTMPVLLLELWRYYVLTFVLQSQKINVYKNIKHATNILSCNVIYRAKSLDLSKNQLLRRVSRRKKSQSTSKDHALIDYDIVFEIFESRFRQAIDFEGDTTRHKSDP